MPDLSLSSEGRPVLAPQVRFKIDPISGEPVLLYPEGLLVLSATAADIVQRCDGKNSVPEIVAQIGGEYDIDKMTLERDVLECLATLSRRALLIFRP
jgi:coenzyme PQQ biosynthesis protein PqqD